MRTTNKSRRFFGEPSQLVQQNIWAHIDTIFQKIDSRINEKICDGLRSISVLVSTWSVHFASESWLKKFGKI